MHSPSGTCRGVKAGLAPKNVAMSRVCNPLFAKFEKAKRVLTWYDGVQAASSPSSSFVSALSPTLSPALAPDAYQRGQLFSEGYFGCTGKVHWGILAVQPGHQILTQISGFDTRMPLQGLIRQRMI